MDYHGRSGSCTPKQVRALLHKYSVPALCTSQFVQLSVHDMNSSKHYLMCYSREQENTLKPLVNARHRKVIRWQ